MKMKKRRSREKRKKRKKKKEQKQFHFDNHLIRTTTIIDPSFQKGM